MIIDSHCHIVPTDEGIATVRDRAAKAGVEHTVLVPGGMIPAVGLADFLRGQMPLGEREPCNSFTCNLALNHPDQFSAMYHFCPDVEDGTDAEAAMKAGFCGFKLNPLVDRVSFNDPAIDELMTTAGEHEVPVYTHIVLHGEASLETLCALLNRHPKSSVILGHLGFASSDNAAIAAARRFENLYLETSVGAFSALIEAHSVLGSSKLLFGSEGPAHHPAVELKKIELMQLPDEDFKRIVGTNAATLLGIRSERIVG